MSCTYILGAFLSLATLAQCEMSLVQVVMVSRHGIRSPYPPTNGTLDDYSSYTALSFPGAADWGMTQNEYEHQYLSPQGKLLMRNMGGFYKQKWESEGLVISNVNHITCYADTYGGATRDHDSASNWITGFNQSITILDVDDKQNAEMLPVLSDHIQLQPCQLATEEQVDGLYGGDVDALTEMYRDGIQKVVDVLEMTNTTNGFHASICANVNKDYNSQETPVCTLFETGYTWIGQYFNEFQSPLYFAAYFAETWMYQYLSNVEEWAFGKLTFSQLRDLYSMFIESLILGTNYWNSMAYSSQQMGYIVSSLNQFITKKPIAGVPQDPHNNVILLFSHDTNILYLRQLLDLSWVPVGHGNNVATTGGALNFELWQNDTDKEYFVKINYVAASPQQQRSGEVLTVANPPSVATLVIPRCGMELCPWKQFKQIALTSLNSQCVEQPLQSSLNNMMSGNDEDDSDDSMPQWELILIVVLVTVVSFSLFLCLATKYLVYSKRIYISMTEMNTYSALLSDNADQKDTSYVPPDVTDLSIKKTIV